MSDGTSVMGDDTRVMSDATAKNHRFLLLVLAEGESGCNIWIPTSDFKLNIQPSNEPHQPPRLLFPCRMRHVHGRECSHQTNENRSYACHRRLFLLIIDGVLSYYCRLTLGMKITPRFRTRSEGKKWVIANYLRMVVYNTSHLLSIAKHDSKPSSLSQISPHMKKGFVCAGGTSHGPSRGLLIGTPCPPHHQQRKSICFRFPPFLRSRRVIGLVLPSSGVLFCHCHNG